MQTPLGKPIPKKALSFTTFPLILSVTCFLFEILSNLLNLDKSASCQQLDDQFTLNISSESHSSLIPRSLKVLRIDSSSFYFMGIMFIIHIATIAISSSRKYFGKIHLITPPNTRQQDEEYIRSEKSIRKQELVRSQYQFEIHKFNTSSGKKASQYLLYFTLSYYLCQFIITSLDSPRGFFVGAKDIHDPIFNSDQNQFQRRMLEESQKEELNDSEISTEQHDLEDRLTDLKRMNGALSTVVSKDGNKIFRYLPTKISYLYDLDGTDITDPFGVRHYSWPDLELNEEYVTLFLSSDSRTLFVVSWNNLKIFNVSHISTPIKYVSTTLIAWSKDERLNIKPMVALDEDRKVLIIATRVLNVFNISDVHNPVRESYYHLDSIAKSISFLSPQKTVLVGTQNGLRIFDLSYPEKPIMKDFILEDEIVFSLYVTNDQKTAIIGTLNKNEAQSDNYYRRWNASLSIFFVDLSNLKSSLSSRHFMKVDQLKTCQISQDLHDFYKRFTLLPEMKITPDSKFAYWACNKDYGFVDIAKKRISRFLTEETINSIDLAQDGKIFLKADSENTNLYALYQNIQKYDPFIWKPVSISRLKLNASSQVFTSRSNRIVYIINMPTLEIYNTSENNFSLISTMQLETKPLCFIPSNDGHRFYMKIDERNIQIYDIFNSSPPQKLASIDFLTTINNDFVVTPDDQIIYATQNVSQGKYIIFANISNISIPLIKDLRFLDKYDLLSDSAKLLLSPDGQRLVAFGERPILWEIFNGKVCRIVLISKGYNYLSPSSSGAGIYSLAFEASGEIWTVENDNNSNQKNLFGWNLGRYCDYDITYPRVPFPVPNLSGNLLLQISNDDKFLYLSTPEYLIEVNISIRQSPTISRLMKLSIKQFSLIRNSEFMYAVIGDSLEILHLKSKYSLTSFREDFPLGASRTIELQLLQQTSPSKWNPVYKKHRFLTANFYKFLISRQENEPILSSYVLPSWINFDKETAEFHIESRLLTHLGTYKISTTGSLQVPPAAMLASSLSFLSTPEQSEQLIADLTERGYLDEERFLTVKYNPYKKLALNPQYSPFESDIRYFLGNYTTNQEYAFNVSSSLFLREYPSLISMETQSPHYSTARIVLQKSNSSDPDTPSKIVAQFVQRTYSSSRGILNHNQTDLTLDGSFININDAFKEIIIDIKEPHEFVSAWITLDDNLNFPVQTQINVTPYFRINAKPIANSDPDLSIQSQVNKYSLVSSQSFTINLHPKSFIDINERPLEYSLVSTELAGLEIRGLTLTGTPPRKFWPSQANVTLMVSNEFKSKKVTFTLSIGMSTAIVLQYVILYFGYLFSGYKMYQNLPKFYNISAQKFYRYPKTYQVHVNQDVNDTIITPIGFFGKEFENAKLLVNYLKSHFVKDLQEKKIILPDFIGQFKDDKGGLVKEKLISAINQVLTSLTFVQRHSVKYYIQIDAEQKDLIHQIILDNLILSEISLPSEKETYNVFKKIKDHWFEIAEQEDPSTKPFFKVNRSKINYLLQNLDSKTKRPRTSEFPNPQKDALLDITQSSVRSRYMSNSHLFDKSISDVEEDLLDSNLSELKNVNIDLLERALQAHAFKSHHINDQREQITIVSNERKVGSSFFYKIKVLLRKHLQKLQFTNKEDLGYGLKYVFKKDVLHFYGAPEARMEYETLVVQILNKKEMIKREIYIFGAENENRDKELVEEVQEQL